MPLVCATAAAVSCFALAAFLFVACVLIPLPPLLFAPPPAVLGAALLSWAVWDAVRLGGETAAESGRAPDPAHRAPARPGILAGLFRAGCPLALGACGLAMSALAVVCGWDGTGLLDGLSPGNATTAIVGLATAFVFLTLGGKRLAELASPEFRIPEDFALPTGRERRRWASAYALATALGAGAAFALTLATFRPAGGLTEVPRLAWWAVFALEFGGLYGFFVGGAQWIVLRRLVGRLPASSGPALTPEERARELRNTLWWPVATLGGCVLGHVAVVAGAHFMPESWQEFAATRSGGVAVECANAAITGLSLGLAQWLALRRRARCAKRWIVMTAVGFVAAEAAWTGLWPAFARAGGIGAGTLAATLVAYTCLNGLVWGAFQGWALVRLRPIASPPAPTVPPCVPAEAPPPAPVGAALRGRRRRRRIAAGALVLLVLAWAGWRISLKIRLASRLDAIRAAGEPTTLAELDAWYPRPPAGQNGVDAIGPALAACDWNEEQTRSLPWFGQADFPPHGTPMPPEMKRAVDAFLADNADTLATLRRASDYRHFRYPLNLNEGLETELPHLSCMKSRTLLLEVAAIHHAEDGRADEAADALLAMAAMAASLDREPIGLSCCVRTACIGLLSDASCRTLSLKPMPLEAVRRLGDRCQPLDDPQVLIRTFAGERCVWTTCTYDARTLRWSQSRTPPRGIRRVTDIMFWFHGVVGLADSDRLFVLDLMGDIANLLQQPHPERRQAGSEYARRFVATPWYHLGPQITLPVLGGLPEFDALASARLRTMRAALAIERFRLERGRLPESLGNLVPACLDAVPADPFTGAPIRYARRAVGYVVYSVGKNGADDGGEEAGDGSDAGPDIVFRVAR